VQKPLSEAPPAPEGVELRRNYLSAIENVAQSVGTMGPVATIGTVLPLLIYKSANATWLLFLGVLVVFCLISASIKVFASRFASAGSLCAFAEAGLGSWAGSLTGWSYLVAMILVVTSSGVSSAYYLALVVSHFTHQALGPVALFALTVLVVLLAWWPSHHDIKLSTKVMLGAESFSVLLIVIILGAAMFATHSWVDRAQLTLQDASFTKLQLGFVLVFMTLSGFESTTALGEEARTATRTLPKVMYLCILPTGIFFMAGIYCLTSLSHGRNLALDQADAPLDVLAQSVGLPTLGWMSTLGVAMSCFGCALGGFNAGSRVIFSMARSGHLWRYFEAVHPVNGTPHRALALLAAIAFVVPAVMLGFGVKMSEIMDYLMQIASFGFLGGYLAVCVAAPVFLARKSMLGPKAVLIAVGTVPAIGAVFFMSLFPVPDAPWRYLPYIFAGLLIAGMVVSVCVRTNRADGAASTAPAPGPAG
jgi:amino acid transporter